MSGGMLEVYYSSVWNPSQSSNSKSVAGELGQPATGIDQQDCKKLRTMTEEMHKSDGENSSTQSDCQTTDIIVK